MTMPEKLAEAHAAEFTAKVEYNEAHEARCEALTRFDVAQVELSNATDIRKEIEQRCIDYAVAARSQS